METRLRSNWFLSDDLTTSTLAMSLPIQIWSDSPYREHGRAVAWAQHSASPAWSPHMVSSLHSPLSLHMYFTLQILHLSISSIFQAPHFFLPLVDESQFIHFTSPFPPPPLLFPTLTHRPPAPPLSADASVQCTVPQCSHSPSSLCCEQWHYGTQPWGPCLQPSPCGKRRNLQVHILIHHMTAAVHAWACSLSSHIG